VSTERVESIRQSNTSTENVNVKDQNCKSYLL